MFLLTQAPNGGALSTTKRCAISSSHSPFSNPKPNPPLFSKTKTKFLSQNPFRKPLNITVAKNSESKSTNSGGGGGGSSTTKQPLPLLNNEETVFVGEENVPLEGVIQYDKPNFSLQLNKWGRIALLSGGDVLFLLLFSAIGRFSHGFSVFDVETLHTADPFIAGWFLSAYFLGGYGEDGRGMNGLSKAVVASAKSWAVGIPLGIIIRAAASGNIPSVSFMLVAMASTGVLLIGWRSLLFTVLPKSKKNDVYKRGSPFEFLEAVTLANWLGRRISNQLCHGVNVPSSCESCDHTQEFAHIANSKVVIVLELVSSACTIYNFVIFIASPVSGKNNPTSHPIVSPFSTNIWQEKHVNQVCLYEIFTKMDAKTSIESNQD